MTDTLEDLVATLRAISETGPESAAPHTITAACAAAADRIRDQEEDYNLLLERAAEIRAERDEALEALVTHAIHMDLDTHKMTCQMCGEEGPISEMVDHEPDCLLASVDTDEEQVERCADCGRPHQINANAPLDRTLLRDRLQAQEDDDD